MDETTSYVYTGEDSRTYEDRALPVQRGDVVEWPDEAPDYRWSPEGSDEANAAVAEKEARELAEAAEAGETETDDGAAVLKPSDGVDKINAYLTELKAGDAELYEAERDRLITDDETRKGLIETGPHAKTDPDPEDLIGTPNLDADNGSAPEGA